MKSEKTDKKDVYALIGDPVSHSASSSMHNAAFSALNIPAVYLILKVVSLNLKEAIKGIKALNIKGVNVTIPHKETCIEFLDHIDKQTKQIQAVNTILNEEGKLTGFNTDSDGFVDSLIKNARISPKGKKIFIMGAGGAARAVSFGLCKNKAEHITLVDIQREKARKLKSSLDKYYPQCKISTISYRDNDKLRKDIESSSIFINATGVGLKSDDPIVINPDFLHKGLLVCDLIYNPPLTKLLKTAKDKGIKTLNGEGMLLYQGIRSFQIWTKKQPPEDIMKKALQAFLKNKQ
jgi:shikimate dehydrogenase